MKWLLLLLLLLFQYGTPSQVPRPGMSYNLGEGKGQVTFPVEPRWERQWVPTSQGRLLLTRVVAETNGGRTAYLLSWHDLPKSVLRGTTPDLLLGRMREGLLAAFPGTVLAEQPRRLEKYAGLECRVQGTNGQYARAWFLLSKERLYQVLVLGSAADLDAPDAQRLFTSFKVLP